MISEEDKVRLERATRSEGCLDWHDICKSECCKIVFLKINPTELLGKSSLLVIKPKFPLTLDERRYYKMRGIDCVRGLMRFKKKRIMVFGQEVIYLHPCSSLEGLLCKDHPTGKPEICKSLNLESLKLDQKNNCSSNCVVTKNCLFNYKLMLSEAMEEDNNGKVE